jgi:hypothetical protein
VHRRVDIADPCRPGRVRAHKRRQTDLPRLDRDDMAIVEQRLQETPLAIPEPVRERPLPPLLVDERPHLKPRRQAFRLDPRAKPADQRQVLQQLVVTRQWHRDVRRVGRVLPRRR